MSTDLDAADVPYWGRLLARRVDRLENLEPAVVAQQVKDLADDMRALKKAFYTFAFSVAASSVLFAFTVFALLGRHP